MRILPKVIAKSLLLITLLLSITIGSLPMRLYDGLELCPVVSTRILRDAPVVCLTAGVQAKMAHLQRLLQQYQEELQLQRNQN
jgi:hypothetical protein